MLTISCLLPSAYSFECRIEYWSSQIGHPSSAAPAPASGPCIQPPQPHCVLPTNNRWAASSHNYQQPQNLQLNRDICVPDHPSNGQRQTTVITSPSQRFTIQPPLQQNQDHHPHQGEFHQQSSRIPRHAASNSYTFGQAASNPQMSQHRSYMSVNPTGMAGRHDYAPPGAAIPAHLQSSIALESPPYTSFSNQQSQGQTQDQLGANGFWDSSGNHRINGSVTRDPYWNLNPLFHIQKG